MYWILVCVTGIPPLEAQMRLRGDRYRDYQSRTSTFPSLGRRTREWLHERRLHHHRHRRTVPLPDVIIRAAIHRLCSRTATRLATGNAESGCGWGSLSL